MARFFRETRFFISWFTISSFSIYHSGVRILQISSAKNFGGGERHLVDLCNGLSARGHEIFAAVRPDAVWLDRLSFLPSENIICVPLRNSFDVFSARKLAGIIRKIEIEVVHAHLARDYPIASIAVRLTRPLQTKLVLTRHVLFPMKYVQKFALSNVSKVIAVSDAAQASLQKTFPTEKIVCVPNGIEIERWSQADKKKLREEFRFQHNISFEAFLIGTIGELKSLKGQEDFILAAQIVAEKFPEIHFVVVGKDNSFDQNFRRKLKRMVKVFGLEERFLWLDWIDDTAEILHSLDIFVSASHSESFGLSILEAMASGTAIVATDTKGAQELLRNNESRRMVSIQNPVALSEAICELIENPEKRKNIARRAQKIARQNFSLEKMISETEKVYQQL